VLVPFHAIINKHFNFCCFRALAYTNSDRLRAVFRFNLVNHALDHRLRGSAMQRCVNDDKPSQWENFDSGVRTESKPLEPLVAKFDSDYVRKDA